MLIKGEPMKKLLTVLIYTILIVLLFTYKESFLDWIRSGDDLSVLISILFFALLVFFPAVPFVVASGIIGASYGLLGRSVIILAGVILGTIMMFLMVRYGFQDWVQNMLDKHEKIKHYEIYFEQNAFIGILGLRLIPIIPFPILNVLCGITGVRLSIFAAASGLGKLPSIIIFTLAGQQATQNSAISISIYVIYFLVLSIFTTRKIKQHNNNIHA
jgi:uncharacterized membrane protein YdjX (TVP38/TMEM64 family)